MKRRCSQSLGAAGGFWGTESGSQVELTRATPGANGSCRTSAENCLHFSQKRNAPQTAQLVTTGTTQVVKHSCGKWGVLAQSQHSQPSHSPLSGLKKLKNESLGTCLVIVLTVPRPLCFCFFLIVLTVTFFPFFQSIVHLQGQDGDHRNTLHEKYWLQCTQYTNPSSTLNLDNLIKPPL